MYFFVLFSCARERFVFVLDQTETVQNVRRHHILLDQDDVTMAALGSSPGLSTERKSAIGVSRFVAELASDLSGDHTWLHVSQSVLATCFLLGMALSLLQIAEHLQEERHLSLEHRLSHGHLDLGHFHDVDGRRPQPTRPNPSNLLGHHLHSEHLGRRLLCHLVDCFGPSTTPASPAISSHRFHRHQGFLPHTGLLGALLHAWYHHFSQYLCFQ